MKTPQEKCDYVVRRLLEQGRPSIDHQGMCANRSPDGCLCAAAMLVPPEFLWLVKDGRWADQSPALQRYIGHPELVAEIQRAHDRYTDRFLYGRWRSLWPIAMRQVYERHGLDPAALEAATVEWRSVILVYPFSCDDDMPSAPLPTPYSSANLFPVAALPPESGEIRL